MNCPVNNGLFCKPHPLVFTWTVVLMPLFIKFVGADSISARDNI